MNMYDDQVQNNEWSPNTLKSYKELKGDVFHLVEQLVRRDKARCSRGCGSNTVQLSLGVATLRVRRGLLASDPVCLPAT